MIEVDLKIAFTVEENSTLIQALKRRSFSSSLLAKIKETSSVVTINGVAPLSFRSEVKVGDKISVSLPPGESRIDPLPGDLDIVYEDDYLLVLNKANNLSVIGTKAHRNRHLSGMIIDYYRKRDIPATVHYVNRLDKDTSGLLIVAKHRYVQAAFRRVSVAKKYRLVVRGIVAEKEGKINLPIRKSNVPRSAKYEISPDGKPSVTAYKVVAYRQNETELEATLITGRSHQLRLHFAAQNRPLIGDDKYGENDPPSFLFLQSFYLAFAHPITGERMTFVLPREWR